MKLKKLQLENFRNYRKYSYEFFDKITVLTGENGKGKTNLLEAIYLLSLGKSFRAALHKDLTSWGKEYFKVSAIAEIDAEKTDFEIFYSATPLQKVFKKNGVALRLSEYVGGLLTVLFHPEDLNILYLSPSLRRRYMDVLLSQTDKKYLQALLKYDKVLKQRNALLKDSPSQGQSYSRTVLASWDQKLAQFGTILTQKRQALVDFLGLRLQKLYCSVSGDKSTLRVEYKNFATGASNHLDNSIPDPAVLGRPDFLAPTPRVQGQNSGQASSPEIPAAPVLTEQSYQHALDASQKLDFFTRRTNVGPHRDDLVFYLNDQEITATASRGEFRTLMIALKLAEIEYIEKTTGESPVLLLDDVFSELDAARQAKLLSAIKDFQVIITTTDLHPSWLAAGDATILAL